MRPICTCLEAPATFATQILPFSSGSYGGTSRDVTERIWRFARLKWTSASDCVVRLSMCQKEARSKEVDQKTANGRRHGPTYWSVSL
jgi:hypothetical protein